MLKDDILSAARAQRASLLPVTAWGVPCFIRVMSGTERDQFEASLFPAGAKAMTKDRFRARLLLRTLVNSDGIRAFDDSDLADLSDQDSPEIDRLFTLASRLNGLSQADVDDLTKNSPAGDGSSISGSPAASSTVQ